MCGAVQSVRVCACTCVYVRERLKHTEIQSEAKDERQEKRKKEKQEKRKEETEEKRTDRQEKRQTKDLRVCVITAVFVCRVTF